MKSLRPARSPNFYARLDITPVPKGRPRFVRATGRAYTDKRTREFEAACAETFASLVLGTPVFEGPIVVDLTFHFRAPKKPKNDRFPITRGGGGGDIDNYAKAVLDAGNGILFADDSLIVEQSARKYYDEETYIEVAIWRL